jgi:hypothetical protein
MSQNRLAGGKSLVAVGRGGPMLLERLPTRSPSSFVRPAHQPTWAMSRDQPPPPEVREGPEIREPDCSDRHGSGPLNLPPGN